MSLLDQIASILASEAEPSGGGHGPVMSAQASLRATRTHTPASPPELQNAGRSPAPEEAARRSETATWRQLIRACDDDDDDDNEKICQAEEYAHRKRRVVVQDMTSMAGPSRASDRPRRGERDSDDDDAVRDEQALHKDVECEACGGGRKRRRRRRRRRKSPMPKTI